MIYVYSGYMLTIKDKEFVFDVFKKKGKDEATEQPEHQSEAEN
jgi:hypothetical protein